MASSLSHREFARRVLIAVGITAVGAGAAAALAMYFYLPLMVFAAVLGAILLDSVATPLSHRLPLPRRLTVCGVALLGLALVAGGLWLSGPRIAEQGPRLVERLPDALNRLERFVESTGWAAALLPTTGDGWDVERVTRQVTGIWQPIAGVFATAFAAATGALVVGAVAFFLALDPRLYVDGLLHLARPAQRARYAEVLSDMGRALRWWLVGRLSSMGVIGVFTTIGLALLGVPLAVLLGLFAGALSFIPYLGPVLAAVPAVMVGLAESPQLALWVILLYTGIQLVESNLVTPLIQERTVSLPPAVLILAQLAMGGLFGLLGVLVATPLAVALIVAVQSLYVRDVLGDPVALMGDHGSRAERRRGSSAEDASDEAFAHPERG